MKTMAHWVIDDFLPFTKMLIFHRKVQQMTIKSACSKSRKFPMFAEPSIFIHFSPDLSWLAYHFPMDSHVFSHGFFISHGNSIPLVPFRVLFAGRLPGFAWRPTTQRGNCQGQDLDVWTKQQKSWEDHAAGNGNQ